MNNYIKCAIIIITITLLNGCHCFYPSLPKGLNYQGEAHEASQSALQIDLTWQDDGAERCSRHEIFEKMFKRIAQAKKFILIDMFLFNDFMAPADCQLRPLSSKLCQMLLKQKMLYPKLEIIVITDEINNVYGSLPSLQFAQLRENGIRVVVTKLNKLRDSNIFYSPFWRIFIQPFGRSPGKMLPNLFQKGERMSMRSFLALLNFKANHRKVFICDHRSEFIGMVTSANAHDGSSMHTNISIEFNGNAVIDLLETEKAVLLFSGAKPPKTVIPKMKIANSATSIQIITEQQIRKAIIKNLSKAEFGDEIDLIMFYLSERKVVKAIKKAKKRGVQFRLILDPNKDAFGIEKSGIPNRQVASELRKANIPIRWYNSHGEQCHAKMMIIRSKRKQEVVMIVGSANYTRRNLRNLNLETNILLRTPQKSSLSCKADDFFINLWRNRGHNYTLDYEQYENRSIIKKIIYNIQEATGLNTY